MNKKNNQRYKNSSEQIETAFLALLLNHNYNEISICQICEVANINRSTFYAHYDDINHLIISIEKKFANSIASIFEFGYKANHEAFIDLFTFIEKNKYFYKAFLNIPYATLAEKNLQESLLKNLKSKLNVNEKNRMLYFYRASFFGAGIKEICRLWIERDCQESPEEIAKLISEEYNGRVK